MNPVRIGSFAKSARIRADPQSAILLARFGLPKPFEAKGIPLNERSLDGEILLVPAEFSGGMGNPAVGSATLWPKGGRKSSKTPIGEGASEPLSSDVSAF